MEKVSLSENVERLLKQRYYRNGETWYQLVERVVDHVCANEEEEFKERIFGLLFNRVFIPNSPCLVNAGKGKSPGLFACFTVGPLDDTLEAHYKTLGDIADVGKAGGGCGFTGSFIRSEGSPVAGSAHGFAYGPNNWAINVNNYLDMMTQGGFRKMALMYDLASWHPDIESFIDLKQTADESFASRFNQSVMADNEFMLAATEGRKYKLKTVPDSEGRQRVVKEIDAAELLHKIAENAWNNGEPGLLFYDTINYHTPYVEEIHTTNPCVARGTLVLTPSGYKQVENVVIGEEVATVRGFEPVDSIEVHENYPVFKVTFSDGNSQVVTAAHQYHAFKSGSSSKKATPIRVDQLEPGDSVRVETSQIEVIGSESDYALGVKQGILLGDGCYTETVIDTNNVIKIASSDLDITYNKNIKQLFNVTRQDWNSTKSHSMTIHVGGAVDVLDSLDLDPTYAHEKTINPMSIMSRNHAIGVLDGLLATDGNINLRSNHPQIRWTTTSTKLAKDIRNILLMIGCHARIYVGEPGYSDYNGRVISGNHNKNTVLLSGNDIATYAGLSRLGEVHPKKWGKIQEAIDHFILSGGTRKVRVTSIEAVGEDTVYDLYCSGSDTWITEGYVQRGCGEQPLPPYGSCNLGSINIAHDYFYDEDGSFNKDALWVAASYATQFLDDVGSANEFPNKKFKEWYKRNRPIGIGIMGYADALLRLKLTYGSEEALAFLDLVMKEIYESANSTSEILGKMRGVPHHAQHVKRRNITLLSIAPTGSISFIAECSSGIEPIFDPSYTRTDERGENYTFTHPDAGEPYFKSAINDDLTKVVSWREHVATQATTQKYVDSGVSKTINFPNNATIEDIKEAMIEAWKSGCKGITVYRDGSRQIQVLKSNKEEMAGDINPDTGLQKIVKTHAPKRPRKLPCEIMSVKIEGKPWTILIGFMEGDPYEVFAFQGEADTQKGVLIKRGNGVYDLADERGKILLKDVVGSYTSDEEQALTRMISLALRHGADAYYILQQLNKTNGTVVSFSKAVMRALKDHARYEYTLEDECENCGSKNLILQEGCDLCQDCGYSKCG